MTELIRDISCKDQPTVGMNPIEYALAWGRTSEDFRAALEQGQRMLIEDNYPGPKKENEMFTLWAGFTCIRYPEEGARKRVLFDVAMRDLVELIFIQQDNGCDNEEAKRILVDKRVKETKEWIESQHRRQRVGRYAGTLQTPVSSPGNS